MKKRRNKKNRKNLGINNIVLLNPKKEEIASRKVSAQ